mgnify:CR=1 FL=1
MKPWRNKSHKSKFNKDFDVPRHAWITDIQNSGTHEIKTESGTIRFEQGIATLPDDSRVNDIHAELQEKHSLHPEHRQFVKIPHKERINTSRTHRYFQGALPPMPWHKYDGAGRRIPEESDVFEEDNNE